MNDFPSNIQLGNPAIEAKFRELDLREAPVWLRELPARSRFVGMFLDLQRRQGFNPEGPYSALRTELLETKLSLMQDFHFIADAYLDDTLETDIKPEQVIEQTEQSLREQLIYSFGSDEDLVLEQLMGYVGVIGAAYAEMRPELS